jgi:hypothetical protein
MKTLGDAFTNEASAEGPARPSASSVTLDPPIGPRQRPEANLDLHSTPIASSARRTK